MPILRKRLRRSVDPVGYWFDGEFRPGFADDPSLPEAARCIIARWAERLTPDAFTATQRDLIANQKLPPITAVQREAEALGSFKRGPLWDQLTDAERALVDDPSGHERLAGVSYPLSIGQLAILVGATNEQLRHWHNEGLLPARRTEGGHRHFYGAAAMRAFLLVRMPQTYITVLRGAAGPRSAPLLTGMAARLQAEAEHAPAPGRALLEEAARHLDLAGVALTRFQSSACLDQM